MVKPSEDIELFYCPKNKRAFVTERVNITRRFEPCEWIQAQADKYQKELGAKLDEVVGFTLEELDCRFSRVRTEETTLGNLMADLMMTECQTDFGLSNGGCLRANQVYKPGPLTLRFLDQVLPMADAVARIKIKGSLFIEAIENGISKYPKYEGRWPVISGLKMQINTDNEPG